MSVGDFMTFQITLETVKEAAARIRPYVAPSPIKYSVNLSKKLGHPVYLKLENLNLSGSFKIRGAMNALLQVSSDDMKSGVIAASAGNHAQGVAHTCRLLGTKATIFMPIHSPIVKAAATRDLGAEVVLVGNSYEEAMQAALERQRQTGALFLHGFNDDRVIAGQGTVALELLEQVPDMGLVLTSIGGGGLGAGVALAIKESNPSIQVVGVQSTSFPAMQLSVQSGKIVEQSTGYTIADGIAIKTPGTRNFSILKSYSDDIVLVSENEIASAVMSLMEWEHMLAEGAGAAAVAALWKLTPEIFEKVQKRPIVCVVSGGNIDVNLLKRIIPIGLKYSGRLFRLSVTIQDRPGRLAELLNIVSQAGANLQEVTHNRLYNAVGFDDVEVILDLETIDNNHQDQVIQCLTKHKFKYTKLG
ncbi:MAG: hypothetical protein RL011_435 [Pseudomonadota bacterium]|jgi:threonine dehydratase